MIGASLGRALLSRGLAGEVIGFDQAPAVLEAARALSAISRGTLTLAESLSGSQLVILATPAEAAVRMLPEVALLADKGSIISDVCSTKQRIVQAAGMLPAGQIFVGGHPMAGSEKDGCQALDGNLFEGTVYVLTPVSSESSSALETMKMLVRRLGAEPLVLGATEHDELVGAVSHLPHLVAATLARALERKTEQQEMFLALAAGGFRDTTRVAMGNPEMWKDICLSNKQNIIRLLDDYCKELEHLRLLTESGDEEALTVFFRHAREFRRKFPGRGQGFKGGATLEHHD
jgi:prephenate dehydrogenase